MICGRYKRGVLGTLMIVMGVAAAAGQPRIPPKYPAEPKYIAQLPKYCYNQYVDGALGGYEFSIPRESCGGSMNHFCPALIFLMQAQDFTLQKNVRVGSVQHAIGGINYTLQDMKPGCFIAKDVMLAKQRAAMLAKIVK
jgi:hypothetical protein